MTRVLVTGASGLLGGRLASLLSRDHTVVATVHRAPAPDGLAAVPLDLASPEAVPLAFEAVRPEAVVHAAALADADTCERDPERAAAVNVRGTAVLAEICARRGARFILLSTDLVFDGSRNGLREDDRALPLLGYGRTKLEAEEEALRLCPGSAVVRVALVCGRGHGHRATSSEGVVWALAQGKRPRLFTDQYRTPVDPEAVAEALAVLLRGRGEGRYHLGGPERVSRYELGVRAAAAFRFDAAAIEATTQAGYSGALRPADVSLDSGRARRELGFSPRPLDEMIRSGRPAPL
jgi:dTDP-4-dehydrorhamnose reductase